MRAHLLVAQEVNWTAPTVEVPWMLTDGWFMAVYERAQTGDYHLARVRPRPVPQTTTDQEAE